MRWGHRNVGIVFGLLGAAALLGLTWLIKPPLAARSMGIAGTAGLAAFVLAMFAVSLRLELEARAATKKRAASPAPPTRAPSPVVGPIVKTVTLPGREAGCSTCAAL